MMQAIVETLFDAVYLVSVITIGVLMVRGSRGESQFRLFGWMAIILGAGDSFHLVPRALALCTTGLENFTVPLGLGKWITSVTMTVFYVLLYYVWLWKASGVRSSIARRTGRCFRIRWPVLPGCTDGWNMAASYIPVFSPSTRWASCGRTRQTENGGCSRPGSTFWKAFVPF